MKKRLWFIVIPLVVLLVLALVGCRRAEKSAYSIVGNGSLVKDFSIMYQNQSEHILVEVPQSHRETYPLVIYHYGEADKSQEPSERRDIAKRLADAGFLVWMVEGKEGTYETALQDLEDARQTIHTLLNLAGNSQVVDKQNINLVGYSMGSIAVLEEGLFSPAVKSVVLIGFGAPYDDIRLYNKVNRFVNEANLTRSNARVLVMVTREDSKVSLRPTESLRTKMIVDNQSVTCIQYPAGDHASLAGNKEYLVDVVRFLKEQNVNSTEQIEPYTKMENKWERLRTTGYW
jgi:dienelactone hydrolase